MFNERVVPRELRPEGDGATVDVDAAEFAGAVHPRGTEPVTGFASGEVGKPGRGPIHPHGCGHEKA